MPYYYSDPAREHDKWSQPDVEVFRSDGFTCDVCGGITFDFGRDEDGSAVCECGSTAGEVWLGAWWYAYGFIGCLWDGDPQGPFGSEDEAVEAARDY